jgi:hypothetical protein
MDGLVWRRQLVQPGKALGLAFHVMGADRPAGEPAHKAVELPRGGPSAATQYLRHEVRFIVAGKSPLRVPR